MKNFILATKGANGLWLGYDGHGFTQLPSSFANYPESEVEQRRKLVADQFSVEVEAVEVGSPREYRLFFGEMFAEGLNRNVLREAEEDRKKLD